MFTILFNFTLATRFTTIKAPQNSESNGQAGVYSKMKADLTFLLIFFQYIYNLIQNYRYLKTLVPSPDVFL